MGSMLVTAADLTSRIEEIDKGNIFEQWYPVKLKSMLALFAAITADRLTRQLR